MHILTKEIKDKIREYAIKNKPYEICGLIIQVNDLLEMFPCKNISFHKEDSCMLNPLDYIVASTKGKIIAYVHSHKSKHLSILDNFNAFNHNIISVVYSYEEDEFYIILPELESYLNIAFEIGKNDCFELVRNYFYKKFTIDIGDFTRDENWYKINPNSIIDEYENRGFIKINTYNNIQINDVIVFNIDNIPSHMAIYLGNDLILHHPRKNRSEICEIGESLKKRICLIGRHKNLL